ncbi:MAG: trypsin-like peptidase domain-containing protein [Pirellulaceae bacterium]|nr:trypsin-like peptidase domain-containing protein [Pirellulaceae bacterium]
MKHTPANHSEPSRRFAATLIVAVCVGIVCWFIDSASLLAQEDRPNDDYLAIRNRGSEMRMQQGLVREIVRVTRGSVAHIDAKKPRSNAGKTDSSSTRVSMIEEAGSGVVIEYRDRYFVVTNSHVIHGAEVKDIVLTIEDRLYLPVDVRHDRESDLAVMLLEGKDFKAARLGNSSEVEVGDFVIAIGSPFGLSQSVSYGIISAKNRHDLELGPQGVRFQDFLQTDATINPGNSGGPLFNLQGEVVGINTAIASNSGGSDGIGFAIPIEMARRVVTDMIDYGYARRGYIGVSLNGDYRANRGLDIGLKEAYGAQVGSVSKDSPAAQVGVRAGDVILRVGGRRVANDSHLVTLVSMSPIDSTTTLTIFRDGQYLNVDVKVALK